MLYDHDTIKYNIFGAYNDASAKIIELAITYIYVVVYHVHNTPILHTVTHEHYHHCHDCELLILLQSLLFMLINCDTDHYIVQL